LEVRKAPSGLHACSAIKAGRKVEAAKASQSKRRCDPPGQDDLQIVAGKGKADYHEPNLPVISAGGNWPGSGIDYRPLIGSVANLEH